jgi:hypothetical protein
VWGGGGGCVSEKEGERAKLCQSFKQCSVFKVNLFQSVNFVCVYPGQGLISAVTVLLCLSPKVQNSLLQF